MVTFLVGVNRSAWEKGVDHVSTLVRGCMGQPALHVETEAVVAPSVGTL
jgi:hypothetical protein